MSSRVFSCSTLYLTGILGETTMPPTVTFTAGAAWQGFHFAFAQFGSVDGSDLLGVLFTAGMIQGRFAFQIDDVRFLSGGNMRGTAETA